MSKLIASTYEIIEKIGSGGGGTVYLANHLRLGKKVVLKADKRKITTRSELLRREVDILKNLRHPYIPQVYDYFTEDDVVYTVMDYVEGESLDKSLKRGEKFSQAQVIKWAVELLEALDYLHSPIHGNPTRGYVHSDIKPANLMLMPDGNICLIDFNIALALGEENVVGRSIGYASPEHYGLDYSIVDGSKREQKAETDDSTVTLINQDETVTLTEGTETLTLSEQRSGTVYKKVRPDVRSDIYSVGATLYHLLSGRRPSKYATEVVPLSKKEFSPLIVDIVTTAMNPNPDLRYQSAAEMLDDFIYLREHDPRTRRLKRRNKIVFTLTAILFCVGVSAAFIGLKRMQAEERRMYLVACSEKAFADGNQNLAIQYALDAISEKPDILTPESAPEAQKALTDALGIYDLTDGFKKCGVVKLEQNPLSLALSPDGATAVCLSGGTFSVIYTDDKVVKRTLPAEDSAMSEVEYLDNDTILYAGKEGITAYSITEARELWTGEPATSISISGDGSTVAAVYKDETHAVLYDAKTGQKKGEVDFSGRGQNVSMVSESFANPYNNLFELSGDGTMLAVSFADGSLSIFYLQNSEDELEVLDEHSGYSYFNGGFSGEYLAFSAADGTKSIFSVIDGKQKSQKVGLESGSTFHVQTDADGIYVQVENILVKMDPVTGRQTPLVTTSDLIRQFSVGSNHTVVNTEDKLMFFDLDAELVTEVDLAQDSTLLQMSGDFVLYGQIDTSLIRMMKYEENHQADILKYDRSFEHDEARISADKKTVMLFSYKQFSIYDMDGKQIIQTKLPNPEDIYDQQFIRKGTESRLEVTYNDGRIVAYDGTDGRFLSEEQCEVPDMSLNEVFYTDDYRIEAPLHDVAQVYDIQSGKKLYELNEDAYLIYVTQAGDYIVTQYVTAEGEKYGVLLNEKCESLADLPYLCDVMDQELYFDYPTGNVRKVQIYNLDSLVKSAQEKTEVQ